MLYFSGQEPGGNLYRMLRKGEVLQIYSGVYTDDKVTPMAIQVKKNIVDIFRHLDVRGVFSYRSSVEFPDFGPEEIVISGTRKRDIVLPGLVAHVYTGSDRECSTVFCYSLSDRNGKRTGLHLPVPERSILENLSPSRVAAKKSNPELAEKMLFGMFSKNPDSIRDRISIVAEAIDRNDAAERAYEIIFGWEQDRKSQKNHQTGQLRT